MARVAISALLLSLAIPSPATADRVDLKVDTSEADAVLAIVARGAEAGEADWARLFSSEPYVRLKKRDAAMKRAFTDGDFRSFVLAAERTKEAPALAQTLAAWKKADLAAAARRVLEWLPPDAVIRAKVYPVIKPQPNSFVFETGTDPAIFLYLDPKVPPAKFENTVAHELHLIGSSSVEKRREAAIAGAPEPARKALEWVGAFDEGIAMLAAAGSPDVHPHALSEPADRERWDRDMARGEEEMRGVERFFLDVVDGRLKGDEAIRERGFSFFGVQGAWYTVGYRMAAVVTREEGRAGLVAAMTDPRKLLAAYQRDARKIAARGGERNPLWSEEFLAKLGATPSP